MPERVIEGGETMYYSLASVFFDERRPFFVAGRGLFASATARAIRVYFARQSAQ